MELFIVIAIIAIIASMVLPALNQYRERARGTHCMNNQKQAGLAVLEYLDDNRQWFYCPDPSVMGNGIYVWSRNLVEKNYIADPDVLVCPSTRYNTWKKAGEGWNSYAARYINKDEPSYPALMMKKVRVAPVKYWLFGCGWQTGWNKPSFKMNIEGNDNYSNPYLIHRGCSNIMFLDGHVEPCNEEKLKDAGFMSVIDPGFVRRSF